MRLRRLLALTLTAICGAVAFVTAPNAHADVDVYATPGTHLVNGRHWRTTCEAYSSTANRCRTEIWATQVSQTGGRFVQGNDWVFNNLTYLPSPRTAWANNPLGNNGTWTAEDGRAWRTECDTAATGRNGCRSYATASVLESAPGGGHRWVTKQIFNNMVRFGATTPLPTAPTDCSLTVEGVPVELTAEQVTATAVNTSGTGATVTMVRRVPGTECDVTTVFRDTTGRIGYGGTAPAATRKQDTGTTPTGSFTVTEAFGLRPNPGTTLPWRTPTSDSYWVLDNDSNYYNQWREGALGGFRKSESERLVDYAGQYDYVAVIDYNRDPAVKGKGGAIFLHVHGAGSTAGCVSITAANMQTYLRNVAAGDRIVIQ